MDSLGRNLVSAPPNLTVQAATNKMTAAESDWIAVEDENHYPLGLVTSLELRGHSANGSFGESLSGMIMHFHRVTAPPGLSAGQYFLLMMQQRCNALIITADGSAQAPLLGVITDSDLSLITGYNPAYLLRKLLQVKAVEDTAHLLQQAKHFLLNALGGPSNIDLCSQIATQFLNATVEGAIRMSEIELANQGNSFPHPPLLAPVRTRGTQRNTGALST